MTQPDPTPRAPGAPDDGFIVQALERAVAMTSAGVAPRQILASLASAGERLGGPGAVCSILVLDPEGLLRNGASPNLPADYIDAIDRLKPGARAGTCAAAAATNTVVVTPDFSADDKWAELRHLPLSLGFVGAWSMPIRSAAGAVIGTFGTYFRVSRSPAPHEVSSVERLAAAAAKVIGLPANGMAAAT